MMWLRGPGRVQSPMPHRRLHPQKLSNRRSSLAAGALVILLLAGFAVWAAHQNQNSVDRVRNLTTVSDAYQQARHAVAQENLAARGYRLEPDHVQLESFARAQASLAAALATVRSHELSTGTPVEDELTSDNLEVQRWFSKLQDATTANDYARVVAIDDDHLQPLFAKMTAKLDRAGAEHHALALASLRDSQRSERMVLAAVAVTIALGLLLLTSTSATMRYRERLERVRRREVERLKQAALIDNLTSLGNHRAFEEDLERALEQAASSRQPLSLALLDLDGLKQINDLHGHQAGDECIRALAAVLRRRRTRYRRLPDRRRRVRADRTRRRAVDTLYLVQHLQATIVTSTRDRPASASAGAAEAVPGLGRDGLIRRADLALIQAKRTHRRCLLYNDALEPILARPDAVAEQRHTDTLATALARAVDAKDAYTHSHCETVSELCALIGEALGMPRDRIASCGWPGCCTTSARSDHGLDPPEARPADAERSRVMKSHTRLGHAIVSAAERPDEADWILHHHERSTAPAIPTGSRAIRSRSSRGSSWWPTPSRRSPPIGPTAPTVHPRWRWPSWSAAPARSSTRLRRGAATLRR